MVCTAILFCIYVRTAVIELGDIPQKNQKEGIFVIPVSI